MRALPKHENASLTLIQEREGDKQSISCLENPKNRRVSYKNPKMFDFRFNTSIPFPESGSRKRVHASGMRGIDFSHKITSRNVFFTKIKKNFFRDPAMIVTPIIFQIIYVVNHF